VLAWLAFAALYKIMPSAKVGWRSAMTVVWSPVPRWSCCTASTALQRRRRQRQRRLPDVRALPLLLVYVQLFWSVVLGGAEICYAVQNLGTLHSAERLPPGVAGGAAAARLAPGDAAGSASAAAGRASSHPCLCAARRAGAMARTGRRPAGQWRRAGAGRGGDELLMPARPPEQLDMHAVQAALDGPDGRVPGARAAAGIGEQELGSADSAAAAVLSKLGF